MSKSENGPKGFQSRRALLMLLIAIFDFNNPEIISVARESFKSVSGNFILEIDVRDGRSNVVAV